MSGRKVHFSVPLHQIEYLDKQWENGNDYARDGSIWMRMGADRQRFEDRIERTSEKLKHILDFEFRLRIYHERFENFVIPEQQATTTETNLIATETATETTIKTSEITENKQFADEPTTTDSPDKQQQPSLVVEQHKTQQNNNNNRAKRKNKKGNKSRQKHRRGHRRKRR